MLKAPIINDLLTVAVATEETKIPIYFYLDKAIDDINNYEIKVKMKKIGEGSDVLTYLDIATPDATPTAVRETLLQGYNCYYIAAEALGAQIGDSYQITLTLVSQENGTYIDKSEESLLTVFNVINEKISLKITEKFININNVLHVEIKKNNSSIDEIDYCVLRGDEDSESPLTERIGAKNGVCAINADVSEFTGSTDLIVIAGTKKGDMVSIPLTIQPVHYDYTESYLDEEETTFIYNSANEIVITGVIDNAPANSYYHIKRDNEVIYRESLKEGVIGKQIIYTDVSAEAGVHNYIVEVVWQSSDKTQALGSKIEFTNIIVDFEDIYLLNNTKTICIKFNPEITSFKRNVLDTITPTLGGAYPISRRNGNQKYRSFQISGLISRHQNEDAAVISSTPVSDSVFNTSTSNNSTSVAEEIRLERQFREEVMDFLYANTVKLFKSETEGNMLITLSNISFTPNKQLGRAIYSFSATATEIDEYNIANCEKYNIITVAEEEILYNAYYIIVDEIINGEAILAEESVSQETEGFTNEALIITRDSYKI